MPVLRLVRESPAPPPMVWGVLADFAAYGSWMPLTRMRLDDGDPHPGWGFAGVSGLGPLAFTDSMLLTDWTPPQDGRPASFRVVKTGRLLGGWARVQVVPRGRGSRIIWDQVLTVALVSRLGVFDDALKGTA